MRRRPPRSQRTDTLFPDTTLFRSGNVRMDTAQAGASGKKVIQAKDVSFSFGDRALVRDFSTTILRGDRIGLIGANGSGKTTLLKLLLGDLQPQAGEIR